MKETEKKKHIYTKTIITLLEQFIEDKRVTLKNFEYRQNPIIYHYYYEIVRYWSKLNYIINKTKINVLSMEILKIKFHDYIMKNNNLRGSKWEIDSIECNGLN